MDEVHTGRSGSKTRADEPRVRVQAPLRGMTTHAKYAAIPVILAGAERMKDEILRGHELAALSGGLLAGFTVVAFVGVITLADKVLRRGRRS